MEKERDQVMVHEDDVKIGGRRAAKRQRRTGGYNGNGNSSNDGIENKNCRGINISNQQQSREEVNKNSGDTINEVGIDNSLVVSNHSLLLAGYTANNALSSAHIDTGVSC